MTDAEKAEMKQMLEAGMIDQAYYDEMTREEAASEQPIAPRLVSPPPFQNDAPPPVTPPPLDVAEWYVGINGQQQGPHGKAKLVEMLAANEITRQAQVWKQGMAAWAAIETVAELQDILASLPPSLTPVATEMATATTVTVSSADMEKRFKKAKARYNSRRHDEAVALLEVLVEDGYAPAQNLLGECYTYGNGVEKNEIKAVKWFRKAAVQGDKDAQCHLGTCYAHGNGVTQNYTEAAKWYRKAIEQGDKTARLYLNELMIRGKV